MRDPDIREMAEQIELSLLFSAEPPSDGLRGCVLAVDAMDDLIQLERRKGPIDGRARGL